MLPRSLGWMAHKRNSWFSTLAGTGEKRMENLANFKDEEDDIWTRGKEKRIKLCNSCCWNKGRIDYRSIRPLFILLRVANTLSKFLRYHRTIPYKHFRIHQLQVPFRVSSYHSTLRLPLQMFLLMLSIAIGSFVRVAMPSIPCFLSYLLSIAFPLFAILRNEFHILPALHRNYLFRQSTIAIAIWSTVEALPLQIVHKHVVRHIAFLFQFAEIESIHNYEFTTFSIGHNVITFTCFLMCFVCLHYRFI